VTVIDVMPDGATATAEDPPRLGVRRVLLVWDAPNLDMGLGSILGGRPTAAHRPRFDALAIVRGMWISPRKYPDFAEPMPEGLAVEVIPENALIPLEG